MKLEKMMFKFCAVLFPVILAIASTKIYSQNISSSHAPEQGARLYFRAPDILPGTLAEMREATYWVSKMESPEEIIMPLNKIIGMNNAFQKRIRNELSTDTILTKLINKKLESLPGLITYYPNLYIQKPSELATTAQTIIKKEIEYLRKGKFGNMLAIEYSSKELDALENEMAIFNIGKAVNIKTGITVSDVRLRIIPAINQQSVGLIDKGKTRWDLWNLDIIPIGSPVQILHVSKSGESLFVLSKNGFGWISSEQVAFGDRKQIEQFAQSGSFVICTGDKVAFYTDETSKYASGWFSMGTRLPLVRIGSREIYVPVRLANGSLAIQKAWFAQGAEVNLGYLPYTRKNIVLQSLKLLDNLYDWTGAWYGRNHATALRDVFACFGFALPGYGELMSAFNKRVKRVNASEGKEEQLKAICANDPFVTLPICRSGHSLLYLGNYHNMPIVYDTNGYGYVDANNREVEIRRSSINTIEFPDYFLKQDIIFITLK